MHLVQGLGLLGKIGFIEGCRGLFGPWLVLLWRLLIRGSSSKVRRSASVWSRQVLHHALNELPRLQNLGQSYSKPVFENLRLVSILELAHKSHTLLPSVSMDRGRKPKDIDNINLPL